MEEERITKKDLNGKFHNTRPVAKPKNKVGGRNPEGHITDPRKTRMDEKSRRQRKWREASSEGGQGPERAVTP